MASASVVGQHPGQHFKLPGVGKKITLPRRQSGERLLSYRRSGGHGGGECGSVIAEGEQDTQPLLSPGGPEGETAARGGMMMMMPGEGCGAAAPRSSNRDREECSGVTGGCESQTGDRNSNTDMDPNHNTARRGGSLNRRSSGTVNVTPPAGESVANGHSKGSHRHRDRDRDSQTHHGRRESGRGGDRDGASSVLAERAGLPTRRLYQGRTGVVKLARPERFRREAWSIFPQRQDPRVRTERGEGHRFEAKPGLAQDWCDACSRMIRAQALKCQSKWFESHHAPQIDR